MLIEEKNNEYLLKYWNDLKAGRLFPSEDDISPDEIFSIWDNCFLMQFRDVDNVQDCNYTYLGENIITAYQSGALPTSIPGMVYINANHLVNEFNEVRENKQPMIARGEYSMPDGHVIRFHQCLMPLGYDDSVVHSILGRVGYEVYPYMLETD